MTTAPVVSTGATVVITHRVRAGMHEAYEAWLQEIRPLGQAFPGHLDWQVIRPIPGIAVHYTVIIRFDTEEHLRHWMESAERQRLIQATAHLLDVPDSYAIHSGLDFWFMPAAGVKVPVRWKQFLVTWSAIFPLSLLVPAVLLPVLRAIGLPAEPYLTGLVMTAVLVLLMTYVVMPHYTRWVRGWLFR
jgi:hypothetical protein